MTVPTMKEVLVNIKLELERRPAMYPNLTIDYKVEKKEIDLGFKAVEPEPGFEHLANFLPKVKDSKIVESIQLTINGMIIGYIIDLKEEYSTGSSSWMMKPSGRYRIIIQQPGKNRPIQLRQKGDGSFSWDKAADAVYTYVLHETEAKKQRDARNNNALIAAEVAGTMKHQYGLVRVSASEDLNRPVELNFNGKLTMTAERAREIIEALKDLGLLEKKEEINA